MTEIFNREKFDGKKSYQSPLLRVYGDILKVTQATGTTAKNADGGKGVNNKT